MDKTIYLQHQALGLEAFNLKASVKAMRELLPNFVGSITQFYSTFSQSDKDLAIGTVPPQNFKRSLKNVNYVAVKDVTFTGPMGLQTTYVQYINEIENSVALSEKLVSDVLQPFSNWVAVMLSTPENLKSVSNLPIDTKALDKERDALVEHLVKVVDPKSPQTSFRYGSLVSRNADWDIIVNKTNDLASRLMLTDRKKIMRMVDDLTEMLSRLVERIEEDPETYQLSGNTTSVLATLCYSAGKSLEQYSNSSVMVQELVTTVTRTVDELNKTFH